MDLCCTCQSHLLVNILLVPFQVHYTKIVLVEHGDCGSGRKNVVVNDVLSLVQQSSHNKPAANAEITALNKTNHLEQEMSYLANVL